jgi:hypothetical protein
MCIHSVSWKVCFLSEMWKTLNIISSPMLSRAATVIIFYLSSLLIISLSMFSLLRYSFVSHFYERRNIFRKKLKMIRVSQLKQIQYCAAFTTNFRTFVCPFVTWNLDIITYKFVF